MTQKTYKREVAVALLAVYFGLLSYGIYEPGAATAAAEIKAYVFSFVGGAFLADVVQKVSK